MAPGVSGWEVVYSLLCDILCRATMFVGRCKAARSDFAVQCAAELSLSGDFAWGRPASPPAVISNQVPTSMSCACRAPRGNR